MPFYRWSDIIKDVEPGPTLPAGMSRQGITVGDVMLTLHEYLPNLNPKPHRHPSAQITYVLRGKLRMRIGQEERVIEPGEFGYVPADVEHGHESLDDYVLALDVFFPPRVDIEARLLELKL